MLVNRGRGGKSPLKPIVKMAVAEENLSKGDKVTVYKGRWNRTLDIDIDTSRISVTDNLIVGVSNNAPYLYWYQKRSGTWVKGANPTTLPASAPSDIITYNNIVFVRVGSNEVWIYQVVGNSLYYRTQISLTYSDMKFRQGVGAHGNLRFITFEGVISGNNPYSLAQVLFYDIYTYTAKLGRMLVSTASPGMYEWCNGCFVNGSNTYYLIYRTEIANTSYYLIGEFKISGVDGSNNITISGYGENNIPIVNLESIISKYNRVNANNQKTLLTLGYGYASLHSKDISEKTKVVANADTADISSNFVAINATYYPTAGNNANYIAVARIKDIRQSDVHKYYKIFMDLPPTDYLISIGDSIIAIRTSSNYVNVYEFDDDLYVRKTATIKDNYESIDKSDVGIVVENAAVEQRVEINIYFEL